jgi:hypothetical protein
MSTRVRDGILVFVVALGLVGIASMNSNFDPTSSLAAVPNVQTLGRSMEETPTPKTPKILVVAMGQARGTEKAWSTLETFVLNPLGADLAWLTTPCQVLNQDTKMLQRLAKYVWEVPEYTDWGEGLDRIDCGQPSNWRTVLCSYDQQFLGGVKNCNHKGSAGILLYFRYALSTFLTPNVLEKYDWFIVTRTDFWYACNHSMVPFSTQANVWHVDGEGYGGVTDRHFVVPSTKIHEVLNITKHLVCHPTDFLEKTKTLPRLYMNLETVTLDFYRLKNISVGVFPRTQFTVRGPNDPTRWAQGEIVPEFHPNLRVKYLKEYQEALEFCDQKIQNVA